MSNLGQDKLNTLTDRLPCPFCKHTKETIVLNDSDGYYYVACSYCNTYCNRKYKNAKEAIDAWNTRPLEEKLQSDLNSITQSFTEQSVKLSNMNFENIDLKEEIKRCKMLLKRLIDFRSSYNSTHNLISKIINDSEDIFKQMTNY
jgi:transcription elongation factor Elf1